MTSIHENPMRIYPDGRVVAHDAARYLGISGRTLANMRSLGTGPRFVKRGKIFYFIRDLDTWLEAGIARNTAEARVKNLDRRLDYGLEEKLR